MWNIKISFTFVFSLFTNEIICDLIKKENNNDSDSKAEIYRKENIDRAIIVRPLPPPFHVPQPFYKPPPPPIILTLGVQSEVPHPNRIPNLGLNPFGMVFPLDFLKDIKTTPQFTNVGFNPGLNTGFNSGLNTEFNPDLNTGFNPGLNTGLNQRLNTNLYQGLGAFGSNRNPYYAYNDVKHEHFINMLDPINNQGPSTHSVQYFGPQMEQNQPLTVDVTNQNSQSSGSSDDPNIEILRSFGFTLPSEITINHPINYAKEYLLDAATSNSIRNFQHNEIKTKQTELLTGEEMLVTNTREMENDEIFKAVESKQEKNLNPLKTFYSKRKPDVRNKNSDKPRNIYEVISAEKITPLEMDMNIEGIKLIQSLSKIDKSKNIFPNTTSSTSSANEPEHEHEPDEDNTTEESLEFRDTNMEINLSKEEDLDLRVQELEKKQNSELLLLLPHENVSAPEKTLKKRSTNESFNVNIGAGYGVGIDQESPYLPQSSTQVNSSLNYLSSILKDENVIIGTHSDQLPKFDSEMVETKSAPFEQRNKPVAVKKGVMNMKEIQQILHNVNDGNEYSKIVQVVKVPAVYEIHLEKYEKNNKHLEKTNHQHAPTKYIQQINNLANKPPRNFVPKRNNFNKDFIKIDDWQRNNNERKRRKKPVPVRHTQHNNQNPIHESTSQINYREKKNTNIQNIYSQHHNNPTYPILNYYPPVQTKYIYSTLTPTIPYLKRRTLYHTHRSELDDNLIYGSPKEKVLNPDEINIIIEPGSTMVTLPKIETSNRRNSIEEKPCNKNYSQQEMLPPPEMMMESSNIDNIYFTTLKPPNNNKGFNGKGKPDVRYFNKSERRSDTRPIKYMLIINKYFRNDW